MSRAPSPWAARLRAICAAAVAVAASFGFLASGRVAGRLRAVVSAWQLFPGTAKLVGALALGSLAAGGIALPLLGLSAVFGRWYCAALCPLGALQDLAWWLGRRKATYRRPATAARTIATLGAVALALLGAMSIASWLDPWSLFGRFLSYDLQPLLQLSLRADLLGFNPWATAAGALAMVAILGMAVLLGRWFCGTLCPVGGLLGLLNKVAPLRLRMEASSCVACGRCAARCPASCIDPAERRIDDARCVLCLSCLAACKERAIYYGRPRRVSQRPSKGMSRARFLATCGGGAALLTLSALPARAAIRRLAEPPRVTAPPGARSVQRYLGSCTACGLCAAACPSKVLRPAYGLLGLRGLLVPTLDYTVSYCQYECTSCLDVCPSGALERMSLQSKKRVKIGDALLVKERCIVFTSKTKCGACAEHCPTGAVAMKEVPLGIPEPFFTSRICIGCGACHHACPVRPERAISVSGLAVHETAEEPTAEPLGSPAQGGTPGGGEEGFPF